jgi:hypothetical protein
MFRLSSTTPVLGLTLGSILLGACSVASPPAWGPGAGAQADVHEEHTRRPTPSTGAPNLLDDYKEREIANLGEAATWTNNSAKRMVVVALMLAAQDKRERSESDAEDAIQAAMAKALKQQGDAADTDPDSANNRLHLPVEFADLFTADATWGWPDRRLPKSREVGDGKHLFEALRSAAARFPSKAAFQCQPQTPGGEAAVATGAEGLWCWHKNAQSDLIAYKLVSDGGKLKISYIGLFEDPPGGFVRIIGYGNPPPSMVPTKRRQGDGGPGAPAGGGGRQAPG